MTFGYKFSQLHHAPSGQISGKPTRFRRLRTGKCRVLTRYITTNRSKVNDGHFPALFESKVVQGFFCRRRQLGGFEEYLCHLNLGTGSIWVRRLCYVG